MPDLELLPAWYSGLQKRKRWLRLQVWLTLAFAGGLGLWVFLADRNQRFAESALVSLKGQLNQTDAQLKKMDELESLRKQLRQQAEILGKMGLHIEASRLITQLAQALPERMSLLGMNFEVEETPVTLPPTVRASMKDPNTVVMDRKLRVRLQGVAPTDLDLSEFLTELNKTSFFDHVAPSYARDRKDSGHLMREFEVSFLVGLTPSQGS